MESDSDYQADSVDSSDQEFEERPNPYAHLGQKASLSMRATAREDRMSSKRALRELTYSDGAPGTVKGRMKWYNMYNSFHEHTMKKDPSSIPTGEDIERFLDTIVKHLGSMGPSQVPSFRYVETGLKWLKEVQHWHKPKFNLNKSEELRLKTTLEGMLKKGRLTKDPAREKQWVTAMLVKRLVQSLLQQALSSGTLSWDVTLSRSLSLLLQAALCSRSGEVLRSPDYEDLECLLYEHITLKLVRNKKTGKEHFRGLMVLAFEKGKKKDASDNREVRLDELDDNKFNVCCVVKLLLVLAMRVGAVAQTTYIDVVDSARSRKDKKIIWTHPEWPVISALGPRGASLQVGKPTCVNQMNTNLQLASAAAGLITHVRPHDIRRGAAKDLTYLPGTLAGVTTANVQHGLGHDGGAFGNGVTQRYAGRIEESTWGKRLTNEEQEDHFGVEFADQPYKKQRIDTAMIDTYCADNKLKHKVRADRKKAIYQLEKQQKQQWVDEQRNAPDPFLSKQTTPTVLREQSDSAVNARLELRSGRTIELHDGMDAQPAHRSVVQNAEVSEAAACPASQTCHPSESTRSIVLPFESFDRDDDSLIDPILLNLDRSQTLGAEADGDAMSAASMEPLVRNALCRAKITSLEDVDTLCLSDPQTEKSTQLSFPVLSQSSAQQFVDYFAKINTLHISTQVGRRLETAVRGGSRDEPSAFLHTCPNAIYGCKYTCQATHVLRDHLISCPASREAHEKKAAPKKFSCTEPGCTRSYSNQSSLNNHIKVSHRGEPDWNPKPCPNSPCDSSVIFNSRHAYEEHQRDAHSGWEPMRCPAPGCPSTHVFQKETLLLNHMRNVHKLDKGARDELLPHRKAANEASAAKEGNAWSPRRCPIQGCSHGVIFYKRHSLYCHLSHAHQLNSSNGAKEFLVPVWPPTAE